MIAFLKSNTLVKGMLVVVLVSLLCGCALLKAKNFASQGSYYFGNHNFNKSAEYFMQAASEDSANPGYLSMLGWSYFKLGDYDKAISTFSSLSEIAPQVLDGHTGKGWSYFKKAEYDLAIASFEQALKFNPNSADAFDGLGWSNAKKGNAQQAERYFKIALKKVRKENKGAPTKTDPEAHRGLGYLSFAKEDFQAALRHFQIATLLSPQWNDARLKQGECLFSLKNYKGAISVYKPALKYGQSADIYDRLGWSYFYLNKYSAARQMFKRALAIDQNYSSSLSGLAEIETKLGPEK